MPETLYCSKQRRLSLATSPRARRMDTYRNAAEVCSLAAAAALRQQGAVFRTLDGVVHADLLCKRVFSTARGFAHLAPTCACEASPKPRERAVLWGSNAGMVPTGLLHVHLPEGQNSQRPRQLVLHSVLECAQMGAPGHARLYCITEADVPVVAARWYYAAGMLFQRCDCYWRLRRSALQYLLATPPVLRRAILDFV